MTITMATGEAKAIIVGAFTKLQTAYPYRVTETGPLATVDFSNGIRVTDFTAADVSSSVITSTTSVSEKIQIGEKVYVKIGGGSWVTATASPANVDQMAALLAAGLTEVQPAGTEPINGVETMSYTFTASAGGSTGTGKIWIGTADGLPYRVDLTTVIQGVTMNDSLVYEYNIQITIKAPIP
jgi:hypothetical protein